MPTKKTTPLTIESVLEDSRFQDAVGSKAKAEFETRLAEIQPPEPFHFPWWAFAVGLVACFVASVVVGGFQVSSSENRTAQDYNNLQNNIAKVEAKISEIPKPTSPVETQVPNPTVVQVQFPLFTVRIKAHCWIEINNPASPKILFRGTVGRGFEWSKVGENRYLSVTTGCPGYAEYLLRGVPQQVHNLAFHPESVELTEWNF